MTAIDYLLKPIDPDQLREAVAKAIQSPRTQAGQVDTLPSVFYNRGDVIRIHARAGDLPITRMEIMMDRIKIARNA